MYNIERKIDKYTSIQHGNEWTILFCLISVMCYLSRHLCEWNTNRNFVYTRVFVISRFLGEVIVPGSTAEWNAIPPVHIYIEWYCAHDCTISVFVCLLYCKLYMKEKRYKYLQILLEMPDTNRISRKVVFSVEKTGLGIAIMSLCQFVHLSLFESCIGRKSCPGCNLFMPRLSFK